MAVLKVGGVDLPPPISMAVDDEIIWSANSGRTTDATMVADVVAEKKTLNVEWGILSEADVALIKSALKPGFFPITFRDDGKDITINAYRGTMSKDAAGFLSDGVFYYRSLSVSLIQQ